LDSQDKASRKGRKGAEIPFTVSPAVEACQSVRIHCFQPLKIKDFLVQILPFSQQFEGIWPAAIGTISAATGTIMPAKFQTESLPKMTTCHHTYRRKPTLSEYQKQIRFLTGLSVIICTALVVGFFWMLNRPVFIPH
jgi:hypothetical protein